MLFLSKNAMPRRVLFMRLVFSFLLLLCVMAWDAYCRPATGPARAVWTSSGVTHQPLVFQSRGHIPMPANTPAAHASSLVAMPLDSPYALMAFWFAGAKESAPDIGIAASAFDRHSKSWVAARFVVDRQALGRALGFGVRRLGNPVAWLDARQRLHLFVVATGLGGWAASRIVHLRQTSNGSLLSELSFEPERVLPLSWFWNTSFLVRTAPMPLQDGGMVLPVHFELGIKYPVALRFDASGVFSGMVRMSRRTHLLQPTLVVQDESHWLALLRDQRAEGRVGLVQTLDGGQHWQDLPDLPLVNPDASVAGLGLAPGRMVLAHNTSAHSRNLLDLSQSSDGLHWSSLQPLAQGAGTDEYSYPAMVWADDSLWVSYTDQRQRIAWQRFGTQPE